jgi:hypothetical protein
MAGMVMMMEGGGLGGSRSLPNEILEQAEKYFAVRNIVLSEQARIQKLNKEPGE